MPVTADTHSLLSRLTLFTALVLVGCETTPLYPTPTGMQGSPMIGSGTGAGGAAASSSGKPDGLNLQDGERCSMDNECESAHCNNDICCAAGDCCQTEKDCPSKGGAGASCEDKETCQGMRGALTCSKFRCRAREGVQDDSACDAKIEADTCGPYASVFCNGQAEQTAPKCPTSCTDDSGCDEEAHCQDGKCVTDSGDGETCSLDSECGSGHCSNGLCCKEGDCCMDDMDCPALKYTTGGTCMDTAMCQGKRGVPACEEHHCISKEVDDDTACNRNVVARDCGMGMPAVKCRGGADQSAPPPCATGTCGGFGVASCNPESFCWQGKCMPDQPNGEGCTNNDACQSGHCVNNVCCEEGDCCENDQQCPAKKSCSDTAMCQGKRQERYCDKDIGACADGMEVDDDTGCAGMVCTRMCGQNLPPLCPNVADVTMPPACVRCTNTFMCSMWGMTESTTDPDTGETIAGVPYCAGTWNPIPIGCVPGASSCNALSGMCN